MDGMFCFCLLHGWLGAAAVFVMMAFDSHQHCVNNHRRYIMGMDLPYWDRVKYNQYENTRMDRNHLLAGAGRKVKDEDKKPEVKPHNEWTPYAGPVIWTGPDGDRDFRPKLFKDWQQLGIGEVSPEKTLSATYISRAPSDQPFGKPRNEIIGEIGWFYKSYEHAIIPSCQVFMER